MKIEIFALCDAATEQQGKLNILGTFDKIWAKEAPCTHPACALAVRMRFQKIEEGKHHIKVTFADEDGKPVLPALNGDFDVRFPPDAFSHVQNLILNIQRLKLENYGEYSLDLAVDNRLEASIPLELKQVPQKQKPNTL